MSTASESKNCPKCGAPIPVEAPQGLCPKCLLLEISAPTDAGQGANFKSIPPTRDELAAAFPHLEILELIGQGGMGFVFKARQPKLDRFVALKILPQSLAADPAFAERFTREGRLLARLNHPNIVTVHDFGQAKEFFYLLMEFVDGVNLRQAMKAGRFTADQALAVVPKICEALQFAHNEGILHRDIKPENILLDTKGRVKIADFGIAKLISEAGDVAKPESGADGVTRPTDELTGAGKTLGTPNYMAPEQIKTPGAVDHRADIYSLGVVFYEMLTGELPLGRFAPPSQKSSADPRLDDVVLRALEKEPNRRTQSASEVKTQVETIAATNPPPQISITPDLSAKPKKLLRRGIMVCSWMFILVVLFTTIVTFLLPETYDAFARVKVEKNIQPGVYDPFWLQTQFEIVGSQPILTNVIQDLKLTERWSLRYVGQSGLTLLETVALLKKSMAIRLTKNTSLIEIHFFSQSSKEAAEIANAIAKSYAAYSQTQVREIEIVDYAMPPSRPVRPNKPLNIAIGVIGGIVLGVIAGLITVLVSRRRISSLEVGTQSQSLPLPDRFWKRFTTAAGLILLAMILIPVFAVLLYMALSFQNPRQHSQATIEQREKAAAIKSDYIGKTYFPRGDAIEIISVERSPNRIAVKGRYNLVSTDSAQLALYITSTNSAGANVSVDREQWMNISKGQGNFELSHSHLYPGFPHVNMYPVDGGGPFAEIYFGTKEEALEESKLDLGDASVSSQSSNESTTVSNLLRKAIDYAMVGKVNLAITELQKADKDNEDIQDALRDLKELKRISATNRWTFGPVIERVLVQKNPDRQALKLSTGDYVKSSPNHKLDFGSGGTNTLRAAGVDLYFSDAEPAPDILTALDWRESSSLSPDNGGVDPNVNIDSISADFFHLMQELSYYNPSTKDSDMADFLEMVKKRNARPHENLIHGKNVRSFITRDGAEGILQIVGTTDNPRGVKIRYKLVQKTARAIGTGKKSPEGSNLDLRPRDFDDLREVRAKLAELLAKYTDKHPVVKAQLARLNELERMTKEEPNASAALREAKAKLAEKRIEFTDGHPEVRKLKERVRELEDK